MKKILWVYTNRSPFVKKDIEMMGSYFRICEFNFSYFPRFKVLVSFLRIFFKLSSNSYDMVVCQFAGYQSFVPALFHFLFKKKLLIIAGGTDCASIPLIRYGNFNQKLLGWATRFSFKHSSCITVVDESLIFQHYTYDDEISNQGIKFFIPELTTPIKVIYNGYDPQKWYPIKPKKNNTFLTILGGESAIQRKGIDMIYQVADFFPDCLFVIVGLNKSVFKEKKNILIYPFIENEKLIDIYSEAEFYLQLSLMEGFPNALCEAMLCECIPIVSDVAAMPKIVGDSGFILKKRNLEDLKHLINQALLSDKPLLAKKARARIEENYKEEFRKDALQKLISGIIN
ncbi:MAG: glycosyltransferase family 4 protein [Bacteroidia bacterium]|nr:glycosyltransferase family 4 protein [Bacteroidia bacterium]